jgi:hypothetical protein
LTRRRKRRTDEDEENGDEDERARVTRKSNLGVGEMGGHERKESQYDTGSTK